MQNKGFTLVEIMVSLTVFLVIMVVSMGAILGVFSANRKSQSLKVVMDNLNSSVESMSREMRFGTKYHCEPTGALTGTITVPQNCSSGGSWVSFLSSDNLQTVYRLNGSTVEKSTDSGSTYVPVTAPEITISSLNFYVLGTDPAPDTLQPKSLIKIQGYAGTGGTVTNFTLETLVSERALDN